MSTSGWVALAAVLVVLGGVAWWTFGRKRTAPTVQQIEGGRLELDARLDPELAAQLEPEQLAPPLGGELVPTAALKSARRSFILPDFDAEASS